MKAKRISIQFSLSINYENTVDSFAYKYLYYNLYAIIFSKSLRKIKVTKKKKKERISIQILLHCQLTMKTWMDAFA